MEIKKAEESGNHELCGKALRRKGKIAERRKNIVVKTMCSEFFVLNKSTGRNQYGKRNGIGRI